MAKITSASTQQVLDVEEFLSIAKKKVDVEKPESLMELSEDIVALSNNKEFLKEQVINDLQNFDTGHSAFYSSQSCSLAVDGQLNVRINLWPTLPKDARRRSILAKVLSYYDYHDHNFSFLTTNYFGQGYKTDLYNYDGGKVAGYIGEQIEAEHIGLHQLTKGQVFGFMSKQDFHSQLPPEELSSSINLCLYEKNSSFIDQYYFDPRTMTISGYVGSESTKRVNAIQFAKYFSNERTMELLESIYSKTDCVRTKVAVMDTLIKHNPCRAAEFSRTCINAKHPALKTYGKFLKTQLEISS